MSLKIAVCTVSDTRTIETDKSGAYLCSALQGAGHELVEYAIVKDERDVLATTFREWASRPDIDVILATGGTGITARDVTPEAVADVVDKWIPGFGELFRYISFQTIGTSTVQSRACAGVVSGTLLFALPGSTGACKDAWNGILQQQLDINHKPCNFAMLLHRLEGAKRSAPIPKTQHSS